MIRRSLLAVAAVIAFSAVAASAQAFADADANANGALPDCTALADAFVLPSSARVAARH